MKYFLPLILLLVSITIYAEVYENTDNQDGSTTYTDVPVGHPVVIPANDKNIMSSSIIFTPSPPPKAPQYGKTLSGTGFFINNNYIITNAHVINGCTKVTIKGTMPEHAVDIKVIDTEHDLALLESSQPPQYFAPLRFNIDDLHVGDKVLVLGYPGAEGAHGVFSVAEAKIVNVGKEVTDGKTTDNHGWLYITDVIEHGNSGSPVLDDDGNVIGVVVAKGVLGMKNDKTGEIVSKQDVGMVISLKTLKNFLDAHGTYADWSTSRSVHDDKYIEENAKNYIVNVQCHVPANH